MLTMKRLAKAALALALAAGPALAQDSAAQRPAMPQSKQQNQCTADAVAAELKASGLLRGYKIDITCVNGNVELSGVVADQGQRDEAVRIAHGVPGVAEVNSKLAMTSPGTITQAQADQPLPTPRRAELPGEPVPSFRAGIPAAGASQTPPPLPPYGWPTYAPYNNYSRVAYPTAYPYQAFPFIGPVHPFPKVPLGWRKVMLEWDDGHWWLSSHSQQRDWWMLRYW